MQLIGLRPEARGKDLTFGLEVCVTSPGTTATITAVRPTGGVGSDWSYLGARAWVLASPADGSLITSADSFPPAELDEPLPDAEGFATTSSCGHPDGPITQVFMGLRSNGVGGGGWTGQEMEYTVEGRRYVLEVGNVYVVCGPAVALDICS